MNNLTEILNAAQSGDSEAVNRLFPLVYQELRHLASSQMQQESPGHTLQPTALVHEAYLRLTGVSPGQQFETLGHFYKAAAEAMRRILIDSARRRNSLKRGGAHQKTQLDETMVATQFRSDELLALSESLDQLAEESSRKAEFVKLRCFAGLSHQDAARVMGISRATADRYWAYAKVWLYTRMFPEDETNESASGDPTA